MIHEATASKGSIIWESPQATQIQLCTLEGKRITVEIKKASRKRSNPQNRYYWGVVIPIARQGFRDTGNILTTEECHDFFKSRFNYQLVAIKGHQARVAKSTTKLDTQAFEDYLKKVRDFCLDWLGVYVPEPEGGPS